MVKQPDNGDRTVASNRRARRNYDILDTYEAGVQLAGSEVKSLRDAKVQMGDGFARIDNRGEVWLHGVVISPWSHASRQGGHITDRRRKLLLNRSEIDKLRARTEQENLSLVPMSIYFKGGKAKVELALARGRRDYDKRQVIAKRDADLEARRALAHRTRGSR
ncbi:MAG: SsrA-binding protein SmpB [Actinomycetia bacterium]|nr:SsrA-binding protein SmpB [Actinomycetes bacterium]MCP4958421.1 SsrA-binding protein SmpB [Actinomycetes bacterium]